MKSTLITLTIITLSFFSNAQDEPKVVVFNQSEQTEPEITARNLVKLSLIEPMLGDISLYYERVLGQNTSFELGAGVTIDDFAGNLLWDESAYYSNTTPLIGGSFGLGFRYYPFVAGDEFYFAPEFKYRYYHSEEIIGTGLNQERFHHQKTVSNFRITVGYNLYFDDKVFMDFYGGIGIAMFKLQTFEAVYDEMTFEYVNIPYNRTIPRPWLTLGIKLGFGVQ